MRAHAAALSLPALVFTRLGALLFFVSLAYFLFSYVTAFGIPAPDGNLVAPITWNVALFTGFALHHSLFARERVRSAIARTLPQPLERSFYVWVASLLFIAVCALWRPVPGIAWQVEGVLLWALRAIQVAGIWLTLRSAAILDIWELAGLRKPEGFRLPAPNHSGGPTANHSGAVAGGVPASGSEFKTTGPYGWVRHPIYSGWFLMVLAVSPMTMTRLVFAVVSCAYLVIAIPFEERSMRASSTGAYERYSAQVRWRLLPGVY